MDDNALLREYAENHSNEAFEALVSRHINLVYSIAVRHVGNSDQAEEITQAVFITLAKKALRLRHDRALSSWLFQATRLTATNFVRSEARRHRREQEAYMQTILNERGGDNLWPGIAPLLDGAVAALSEKDRRAIVLRFYEGRNLREVGAALGVSEEASKKRVARALERLQRYFFKRGMDSTTAAIAETISANSIQAAPALLAKSVTAMAITKGVAASTSTSTLINGTLKIMAWTKTNTAVVAGVVALLAAGTTTLAVKQIQRTHVSDSLWRNPHIDSPAVDNLPPEVKVLPTIFPGGGNYQEGTNPLKCVGIGQSAPSLISAAYRWPRARMIFTDGIPPGNYDFISTLAQGDRQALRDEVKNKLGLVGHPEMKNEDALLLVLQNPNAPGLHPPKQGSYSYMENHGDRVKIAWANKPISNINGFLQSASPLPIIDETGVTNDYSVDIRWTEDLQDPEHTALQKAMREQLGLVLVPTNLPVQMLVVEKVN